MTGHHNPAHSGNNTSGPAPQTAGLYVHIPFCTRKCAYCDFYSISDNNLEKPYLEALYKEMGLLKRDRLEFDSLYLGGGTPSILGPTKIGRIVSRALQSFHFTPRTEITFEVNPGTVTRKQLDQYRSMGINRLSIGIQSFQEKNLKFLGRSHSASQGRQVVQWVREAGVEHVGLDLIYGLPSQTTESWKQDLEIALGFTPQHLSCYLLTYEPRTPLGRAKAAGQFKPLTDEATVALFKLTSAFLKENGYEHYEISNFAKQEGDPNTPNRNNPNRSRHNQKYWQGTPYLGLGPSAHSFFENKRWWNLSEVVSYINALTENRLPIEEEEILTREQKRMEAFYVGLRTSAGIRITEFEANFGGNFTNDYQHLLDKLLQSGLALLSQDRFRLTTDGMLLHEGICRQFVDQAS